MIAATFRTAEVLNPRVFKVGARKPQKQQPLGARSRQRPNNVIFKIKFLPINGHLRLLRWPATTMYNNVPDKSLSLDPDSPSSISRFHLRIRLPLPCMDRIFFSFKFPPSICYVFKPAQELQVSPLRLLLLFPSLAKGGLARS